MYNTNFYYFMFYSAYFLGQFGGVMMWNWLKEVLWNGNHTDLKLDRLALWSDEAWGIYDTVT